jgi:hypothetical protein
MDIIKKVKELNLPLGSYVVFGSGPLHVHGIRETSDIDILTTPEIYNKLKNEGWQEADRPNSQKVLLKDEFDVGTTWHYGDYNPDVHDLISTADIIEGIPFGSLDEVIKSKTASARDKDLKDIQLIRDYLAKNNF